MSITSAQRTEVIEKLSDWRWRVNNLYWIVDKRGQRVPFRPNGVQMGLIDGLHTCNLVLKARQHGLSTLIQILMLDACVFNPDIAAGTIAHTRPDAQEIFRTKARYPYDNLPDGIKDSNPAKEDAAQHLRFANNSSILVGTSLRSGTFQYLHVSEYGKLCAKFPEKAREVKTGALNTVQAGQMIFVESTAEGQEGHFHELCEISRSMQDRGEKLGPLDFKFHFFPWHEAPEYRLEVSRTPTEEEAAYFDRLAGEHGIILDQEQRNWWVAKSRQQGEDMFREFPSTPDEAFHASIEGAYYAAAFRKIDKESRVCDLPVLDEARVDTWWDLGLNDEMVIWFVQEDGAYINVVDYYENSGEGLGHYADVLSDRRRDRGFRYGRHLWPHDGSHRVMDETGRKRNEIMVGLGYQVEVMQRGDLLDGIEATRDLLSKCRFDERHTAKGLKKLRHYRKEWDDNRGVFKNRPLHDENSHAADGFRTGAMDRGGKKPDWSKPASVARKRL
jgi:hypothetical protein